MKVILLTVLILSVAQGKLFFVRQANETEDRMSDTAFFDGMMYHMWNGFVKGIYREQT